MAHDECLIGPVLSSPSSRGRQRRGRRGRSALNGQRDFEACPATVWLSLAKGVHRRPTNHDFTGEAWVQPAHSASCRLGGRACCNPTGSVISCHPPPAEERRSPEHVEGRSALARAGSTPPPPDPRTAARGAHNQAHFSDSPPRILRKQRYALSSPECVRALPRGAPPHSLLLEPPCARPVSDEKSSRSSRTVFAVCARAARFHPRLPARAGGRRQLSFPTSNALAAARRGRRGVGPRAPSCGASSVGRLDGVGPRGASTGASFGCMDGLCACCADGGPT